jgi:hypothetical protein
MKAKKGKYKLKKDAARSIIEGAAPNVRDAADLTHDEIFGDQSTTPALNSSETGEDENEGLGDGKMGRAVRNPDE